MKTTPRFQARHYFTVLVALFALTVSTACGASSDETQPSGQPAQIDETAINPIGDRPEISAWTRPSGTFSYDDFINAGWKQYQIYDVDTLPSALEARYGFFNRKDFEIRRYESHDEALEIGAKSAQEALDRVVHDGSGFASRRVYGGYLVVGNYVMMCEVSTDDCVSLVKSVESTRDNQ